MTLIEPTDTDGCRSVPDRPHDVVRSTWGNVDNRPYDRSPKTALAPDLRRLDERAARAWRESMAVRPLPGSRYAVDSASGATYVVDVTAGRCSCPDHQIRGERCKHIRRVAIEITARRVPPPGQTRAACDGCGAETFVPENAPEPHLCGTCQLDPGDIVLDRETGDRFVAARVTARRADKVPIRAADCTVADYPTNEGYPTDDLVVEATYLGDGDRRYSFPRSRLERTDDATLVA